MAAIVILGLSGSGKDTLAEWVQVTYNAKPFKFKWCASHYLEDKYNLPRNALDKPEYKAQKPNGGNKTYLEIMIGLYHFWQEHDPLFSIRGFIDKIHHSTDYVFTDVRTVEEANVIKANFSTVIPLLLIRGEATNHTSDAKLEEICDRLKPHVIHNNTSKSDLFYKAGVIIDRRIYSR